MFLRFEDVGRLGLVALFALACSDSEPSQNNGSGGAGSSSGGMSSAGNASSGSSSGGGGNNTAGSSAGSTTAGSSTGGANGGSGGASGGGGSGGGGAKSKTTFFVSSDTSMTGKLGGLDGADKRCQDLAKAAGIEGHTFHAYLSTSTMNAKDRIGTGPWTNSMGAVVAADVAALHALKGSADLFIDEKMMKINGQWQGSPQPNQHDILTGSMPDGTVQAGQTCMDWTSDAANMTAQVGHSDGMGPGMATTGTYSSWNSAHVNGSCAETEPKGGAGRIYCFAID